MTRPSAVALELIVEKVDMRTDARADVSGRHSRPLGREARLDALRRYRPGRLVRRCDTRYRRIAIGRCKCVGRGTGRMLAGLARIARHRGRVVLASSKHQGQHQPGHSDNRSHKVSLVRFREVARRALATVYGWRKCGPREPFERNEVQLASLRPVSVANIRRPSDVNGVYGAAGAGAAVGPGGGVIPATLQCQRQSRP